MYLIKMRRLLALIFSMAMTFLAMLADGIKVTPDMKTGALAAIYIDGDSTNMNWTLAPDGQQYTWVTEQYGWGLGYMTLNGTSCNWNTPVRMNRDATKVHYQVHDISVNVSRTLKNGELQEKYTFKNTGKKTVRITDWGIYTPWNDNYPNAATCVSKRCNAHIWAGDNATYVCAIRMGDQKTNGCQTTGNVGLVVTQGAVADYEIWERDMKHAHSNFRGVISMALPDLSLCPGQSYTLAWTIVEHGGQNDFERQLLSHGSAVVKSDKYVYQKGDTVKISVLRSKQKQEASFVADKLGEQTIALGNGKDFSTHATILTVGSYAQMLANRARFILEHQQMNNPDDPRCGAYMVYDNETAEIYKNDGPRSSSDTDEGRERIGMGNFLTQWYIQHPSDELKKSLVRYAAFFKNKLQTSNYTTYSRVNHSGKNRGYNYPWAATFYFAMYDITGDTQYARDGYQTMQALFRRFGHGFYCIDMPVLTGLKSLKRAGMIAEHDSLLADYTESARIFIKNGLNFPKFEVNYEQSIVAPAVEFLLEMYLYTKDAKYLATAKELMPVAENFCGRQPHYRLHEIAIRHWDGYWFGKHQMFGDVFPHYWSCINAMAYHYYAKATGDDSYQTRAEEIVRNNLCNVYEDGSATCAYVFPKRINGKPAHRADAFANDQDWALYYYLRVNE